MRTFFICSAFTAALTGLCIGIEAQGQAQVVGLDADIETTYTLADGKQVVSHGHMYRDAEGRVREESQGGALITDAKNRTMIILSTTTKSARVIHIPNNATLGKRPKAEHDSKPFEHSTLNHRRVSKMRATGPSGEKHEVWTDDDAGLIVFSQLEAPGFKSARLVKNINMRNPDRELFSVPADYSVTEETLSQEAIDAAISRAGTAAGRALPKR